LTLKEKIMNSVIADLRQLDNLNIQQQGSSIAKMPPGTLQKKSNFERSLVKGAITGAQVFNPSLGCLLEPIKVSENRPATILITPPTTVPIGLSGTMPPAAPHDLTLSIGWSGSVFMGLGSTIQGGLYGSTFPEFGLFASVAGGFWTNIGVSTGPVATLIFGPPSDFAGAAWGIGIDAKFLTGAIGGLLLFSDPPFRFLGLSISLSAGPSAIPGFDFTVQYGGTMTKPLLN
jgi:hypothetical protein